MIKVNANVSSRAWIKKINKPNNYINKKLQKIIKKIEKTH